MRKAILLAIPLALALLTGHSVADATGPSQMRESRSDATRLILLGTAGGPINRKFRAHPANLVVVNGKAYLIDAGNGVERQLAWVGYRPVDLEAIFITHHHLDHNADVGSLIGFNWVQSRRRPLPIIGPEGTKVLVQAALDYFWASERIYGGGRSKRMPAKEFVAPKDIEASGVVYQDENIRVTAAENSHYQTFEAGTDKSYAYRIDTKNRSIVFTGDTGPSPAVVRLAKGADILVSEVIDAEATIVAASKDAGVEPDFNSYLAGHMRLEHLSPEEVGKLATAAGVKMVVLSHIAPGLDGETDATRYSQGVKKHFKGPVIVGQDLLEL